MTCMSNNDLIHTTDHALDLIDRAHSALLAAHAVAVLRGRDGLAHDLHVLARAGVAEGDALFEGWLRELQGSGANGCKNRQES